MSYLGAKSGSGVYQAIIAAMPPHRTYIEAFLGSGQIMRRKPRSTYSIGIDLDPRPLEDFWHEDQVETINADAITWIEEHRDRLGKADLIYCDPPYLESTRLAPERHRYKHELSNDRHLDLLRTLNNCRAQVMISGYRSEIYDQELAGWRRLEYQAMTRGGPRTECLWMNYPAGRPHWHTYAGADFTDRQRIQRKAATWARRFAACQPGERLAILAAILETEMAAAPAPMS